MKAFATQSGAASSVAHLRRTSAQCTHTTQARLRQADLACCMPKMALPGVRGSDSNGFKHVESVSMSVPNGARTRE